jgi:hypothetical protein|tara:strand:- start:1310 stop:1555 length:246 start_codon:yes stop_codon:yes gene_type:complete
MKEHTGEAPIKEMALIYEKAWNDVVEEQPPWKKSIIINNFEVISGRHIYHSKADQRMMVDIIKEARERAEDIIEAKWSGKY